MDGPVRSTQAPDPDPVPTIILHRTFAAGAVAMNYHTNGPFPRLDVFIFIARQAENNLQRDTRTRYYEKVVEKKNTGMSHSVQPSR